MNLQESIRRVLREEISNRGKDKLINMIKTIGFEKTSKAVGDIDNLKKVTGIHNVHQFMELFSNLKPKKSESKSDMILYKNDEGTNVFLYIYQYDDTDDVYMLYLNHDLIYRPLVFFRETQSLPERHKFLQKWLKTHYNLNVGFSDIDGYKEGDFFNIY